MAEEIVWVPPEVCGSPSKLIDAHVIWSVSVFCIYVPLIYISVFYVNLVSLLLICILYPHLSIQCLSTYWRFLDRRNLCNCKQWPPEESGTYSADLKVEGVLKKVFPRRVKQKDGSGVIDYTAVCTDCVDCVGSIGSSMWMITEIRGGKMFIWCLYISWWL